MCVCRAHASAVTDAQKMALMKVNFLLFVSVAAALSVGTGSRRRRAILHRLRGRDEPDPPRAGCNLQVPTQMAATAAAALGGHLGFEAPPDNAGAKLCASGLTYDIGLGSANKSANTAGAGSKSAYSQSGGEDSAARLALVRSKLSDQLNEITALVPLIENAKWAELGREMTSPAMQEFNLVLSRLALDSPELQAKAKATR